MRSFALISAFGLLLTPCVFCASIPWTLDKYKSSQAKADEHYLQSAARQAMRNHANDPMRCVQYQISDLLWTDTKAIFKKQTGREAPDCPFMCSKCHTIFDDYIQSTLHRC